METHTHNKKNPFCFWESYVGAIVGFVAALQITISRMLITGELTEAECGWNPPFGLSCSQTALLLLILLVIAGFLIGWRLGAVNKAKHEKNISG